MPCCGEDTGLIESDDREEAQAPVFGKVAVFWNRLEPKPTCLKLWFPYTVLLKQTLSTPPNMRPIQTLTLFKLSCIADPFATSKCLRILAQS